MRRLSTLPAVAAAFGLLTLASSALAQTVTLTQSDTGVRVDIDGKLFTEYVTKDVPRPFFYPVIGGAGENIVRNFPMKKDVAGEAQDHPHHRGLWFTHGAVNGIDFWAEVKEYGKQQATGVSDLKAEGNKGSFTTTTKWIAPDGKAVLSDTRKFTFTALPNGEKLLDYDITLQATEGEVVFGDTKEGTMAIRLSSGFVFKKEGDPGAAYNAENVKFKKVWGARSPWVAYYGPDPKGNVVGVAMFDHPKNFRAPTYWHARDYGLFAANPFGVHDFEGKKDQKNLGDHKMAKGESLQLRYRFFFGNGKPMPKAMAARYEEYVKE
jgi:hypothetical protein